MNDTLKATMDMVRAEKRASQMKVSRNFTDFLADRIVQAGTEPTLLAFVERLSSLLDCDSGYIGGDVTAALMRAINSPDVAAVLEWVREYPRIVAMVVSLKDDADYTAALEQIEVAPVADKGTALPGRAPQVGITITCESPLAHGADSKAGNATIFRRCQVLSTTGQVLSLPFYAGNAVRGQMRDLLADDFLRALGLTPRRDEPPCKLWFFHALYAGGALEENSAQAKAIAKKLGNNGAVKAEGIHELRDMIPHLSALGYALGNRIISGRLNVCDCRPRCAEWGSGETPVASLMEWTYLTRREDHEGHADDHHSGMIANTECLRAGTMLEGGLDIHDHATDIERSAIGRGLELLSDRGWLGAENRRGLGQVAISLEGAPAGDTYSEYLAANKDKILDYLETIGAINAQGEMDL
jgi:hypothetical protein